MTKYLANHELIDLATPKHLTNVIDLLVMAHNLSVEASLTAHAFGPMSRFAGAKAIDIERGRQAGIVAALAAICGKSAVTIMNDLREGKLQPRHDLDETDGVVVEDDWEPRTVRKPSMTEDAFVESTGAGE